MTGSISSPPERDASSSQVSPISIIFYSFLENFTGTSSWVERGTVGPIDPESSMQIIRPKHQIHSFISLFLILFQMLFIFFRREEMSSMQTNYLS